MQKNVDPSIRIQYFADNIIGLPLVGYIGTEGEGLRRFGKLGGRFPGTFFIGIDNNDPGPFPRESGGRFPAQTASAPGYNNDPLR
jgi:hypothetical protein